MCSIGFLFGMVAVASMTILTDRLSQHMSCITLTLRGQVSGTSWVHVGLTTPAPTNYKAEVVDGSKGKCANRRQPAIL